MLIANSTDRDFIKELEYNFNIKLNKGQEMFVLTIEGAVLVIACPGAGKTYAFCIRIYNMIENYGIDPRRILAVTFSNASAKDMAKKFNKMFGEHLEKSIKENMKFSTIHSFAYRVLLDYGRLTNKKYALIESPSSPVSKRKIFNDIYLSICEEQITDDVYDNITQNISYVKNRLLSDAEIMKTGTKIHYKFFEIYTAYESYKKENGYIDYDDMLSEAYYALNTHLDIRRKYTNMYDYILVDEAQDTSTVQFEIIRIIASKGNICLIGDDDQNIYQWRSADVKYFLEFEKYFNNPKKIFMEQNFRSSKKIVQLGNAFIKGNKVRYNKELFTENEEGENINIIECYQYQEQISYIMEHLKDATEYDKYAIIYRNNNSAFTIANMLMQQNIPFFMRGYNEKFFNHWILKDIQNFFYFALNPKDYSSFISIAYKMNRYISKVMVDAIKRYAATKENQKDAFEIILDLDGLKSYQRDKIKLLKQEFIILKNKRVASAIKYICNDLGYLGKIEETSEKYGHNMDTIKEIIFTLEELSSSCKNLDDFDMYIHDYQENLSTAKNNFGENAVTLTTAHSSKGLEWKNVFMVDLVNGVFPAYKEITEEEKESKSELMEASRRLFYTGLTRAISGLHFLYFSNKNDNTTESSKFIEEIRQLDLPFVIELKRGIPPKIKSFSPSFKKKTKQAEQISLLDGIISCNTNKSCSSISKTAHNSNVSSTSDSCVNVDNTYDTYTIGNELIHKTFGKGKIVKLNNGSNIIEVLFDSGENKKINIDICRKKNLIL